MNLVGDKICESCHASCKTCSGSSETQCLTCYPTKVFFSNSCWDSCPDGSSDYNLVGDKICESCHASCKTCSGSSETQCLTCYPTKVFFSNSCWDSCPDGSSDYNQLETKFVNLVTPLARLVQEVLRLNVSLVILVGVPFLLG
jgi:hypothetical protein